MTNVLSKANRVLPPSLSQKIRPVLAKSRDGATGIVVDPDVLDRLLDAWTIADSTLT